MRSAVIGHLEWYSQRRELHLQGSRSFEIGADGGENADGPDDVAVDNA